MVLQKVNAAESKAGSRLGVALCWIHLGELEEKAGQWAQAIAKYQHAEKILRSVGDQWHWMEAVISLIRANIDKGDLSMASHYMKEAEPVAEQLGAWEDLEALYREKSRMCSKRGDSEQAFMNYKKSQVYRDSLISEKKIQHIQNIRIKHERESREQQMQVMKRDIEQERRIKRVFLLSGLCIILLCAVIIVFLWYVIRIRSKNHKMQVQIQQAKDHFFMNITHEFRTPLTIILGFGRQMTDGTLTTKEELKKAGGMILRQGNGLDGQPTVGIKIAKEKSVVNQPLYRHGDAVTLVH
ncbi:MAG: phosphoenolpyruvate carboxylase [Hoylesella buccalis]